MKLRDYQKLASDAVFKEWEEGQSTLCVLPTGVGKTIIFADVIRRMAPKRSIVIAHRGELIWQARDKIESSTGMECSVEMAELTASTNLFSRSPVVIATVQTLVSGSGDGAFVTRRMERFNPMDFGCLVIDEAHHATSATYKSIIGYFTGRNPGLKVLGVTATPDRTDEEALGQVFKTVAFDYEILDAINDGWLVPVEQQMVHIEGLDLSKVRTTGGDLNGGDLNAVLESESNLHGVASASLQIIGARRTIVFTSSVKQAEVLCDIFNRHRAGMAAWVCGATPKERRQELLGDFQTGRIQVVVNCSVLTEGFDNPGVECIVMAKPTKSRSLYAQMAGRSLRPLPGSVDTLDTPEARRGAIASSAKPSALIVDFVGNAGRHKLMTTADILSGNVSDEAVELAIKKAKAKGAPVNMTKELEEAEKEIQKKIQQARIREAARKSKIIVGARYSTTRIDPFNSLDIVPVRERGWDSGRVLSESQRRLLVKQGFDPNELSYAQGRQVIGEMFRRWNGNLCGPKQVNVLKKYKWVLGMKEIDTRNMSRVEASQLIGIIAEKQHWKKRE